MPELTIRGAQFAWNADRSDGGWHTQLMCVPAPNEKPAVVWAIGWGWDRDHPLRPWPQGGVSRTPAGHLKQYLLLLGFYLALVVEASDG